MTWYSAYRSVKRWFSESPERGRLDGAIKDAEIIFAQGGAEAHKEPDQHLKQAREYLAAENLQQGWSSLQSAQRSMLLNSNVPNELELAAIELRREAEKISGWRAKAIADLICDANGELRKDILSLPQNRTDPSRMRVINALALRDDQFRTTYFKISLRRRHLYRLFLLLLVGIAASLLLSRFGILPEPFNKIKLMSGVVLFGALGAALSVARDLLAPDISAKIPAQQLGAFVIWMRPAIGATAALISFVLLNAKAIRLFDWDPASPAIIFSVAIVAGFTERFITGALERIVPGKDEASGDKKKDTGKDKAGGDKKKDKDEGGKDNKQKQEGE
jgi:hypothetical protein